jgi:hypothetical protein
VRGAPARARAGTSSNGHSARRAPEILARFWGVGSTTGTGTIQNRLVARAGTDWATTKGRSIMFAGRRATVALNQSFGAAPLIQSAISL